MGNSTIGGLMDTIATLVSLSLQYGVPLEDLVRKFAHQRFEPSGYTLNPQIRVAKSIVDYIFRWLGLTFIAGYEGADLAAGPVSGLSHANKHEVVTRGISVTAAGISEIESNGHGRKWTPPKSEP
jgi:ribonucleoside-diphosphate reductase alpha chain